MQITPIRSHLALSLGVFVHLAGCTADPDAASATLTEATDGSSSTGDTGDTGVTGVTDDTEDSDDTGATGGPGFEPVPAGDCGRADLKRAQPAVRVEGVPAVPIDVESVDATIVLDAAAKVGAVDATMQFVMGGVEGFPVLDLRQNAEHIALNGAPVDPLDFPLVDFGGGMDAEMRLLRATAGACSEQTLELAYTLATPQAPGGATGVEWDPKEARVRWNFNLRDGAAARFMEQWLPANLIHDSHPITLDIELVGGAVPHTVVTNAEVEVLVEGAHWLLKFPATSNSMSPLVVLMPSDELESHELPVVLPDGHAVTIHTHRPLSFAQDLAMLAQKAADYLSAYTLSTGPYPHGDRFTVFMGTGIVSVEYDGGTVMSSDVIDHESFHSWYGRGVRPQRQTDGWIDEGWASYNTTPGPSFAVTPLPLDLPPFLLYDPNPWTRIWPDQSYGVGNALFAGFAAIMGLEPLRAHMADFYQAHILETVTTHDLEKHLACQSGFEAEVRAIFHRYVYGRDDAPPAPGDGFCE